MAIEEFDIGNTVLCDFCNEDFTHSEAKGGLLFQSKAACPNCAPSIQASAVRHGETQYIRLVCPDDMAFKDFVLWIRGGNNKIRILTGKDCKFPDIKRK